MKNRAKQRLCGFARFCLRTEDDCGGGDLVFCEEFLFFA